MRALIVLLLCALAGTAAADGGFVTYKVQPGDTLQLLAAEYYGDRKHAVFIMVANKMPAPRPLRPGEKLRVPVTREVTAKAGDTFEGLAQVHLGDKRRASYLADFNDLDATETLAAGQTLTIPFHVVHAATAPETLANIAGAYFGSSKNAGLLRGYNFLDEDAVAAGQSIVVPINHVKVRASALPPVDAESKARNEKRRTMMEQAARALPRAEEAWRAGLYADVKRELVAIDLDFLDSDVAAAAGQLLGAAYVAQGDEVSARAAFERAIERRPRITLSRYRYSPRIAEVWTKAGGKVED